MCFFGGAAAFTLLDNNVEGCESGFLVGDLNHIGGEELVGGKLEVFVAPVGESCNVWVAPTRMNSNRLHR